MLAPISKSSPGSRKASRRSRAAMRMWWLHLGQTYRLRSSSARYRTASQAGHFIHKPSGTERVRRSVLIRDGMIFSNQDMTNPRLRQSRDHNGSRWRQLKRSCIAHEPQVQPFGGCRRPALRALFGFEHGKRPAGLLLAAPDRNQQACDVAHHVMQIGIGGDLDHDEVAVALDAERIDAADRGMPL